MTVKMGIKKSKPNVAQKWLTIIIDDQSQKIHYFLLSLLYLVAHAEDQSTFFRDFTLIAFKTLINYGRKNNLKQSTQLKVVLIPQQHKTNKRKTKEKMK